ncbi:MAG: 4-hydroxy-tetrahydrodipicolinate reductase [Bacteroidetes bacterium]|nr:4-hydroxy-tetrahydrodipicolinate reductase [Bacteroidota bacterium]MCB9227470.1 4-hydroxy-tetrahydrodipicolinate reductase [Chitinophagales bacterium]
MKVALLGYGKMGKTIEPILIERGHEVVLKITAENIDKLTSENLKKADIAIEFSRPESAVKNYVLCFENNIPVVSGTTAWQAEKELVFSSLKKHNGTFFYAPNFSIGVNIFFKINEVLAKLMNKQNSYDVEMEEIHHTQKLDSPSGTAIKTAEIILNELENKKSWQENKTDTKENLLIKTFREENVPGTHKVRYFSDVDELTFEHVAFSRKGFALGAVLAAEWVVNKKGYFEMKDMLNL